MSWVKDIPANDSGWMPGLIHAILEKGATAHSVPLVTLSKQLGEIPHRTKGMKLECLVNLDYPYRYDGADEEEKRKNHFTWYPVIIPSLNHPQPFVWIPIEYILGPERPALVPDDEPHFFDLQFPGQPTIRLPMKQRDLIVQILHALANYVGSLPGRK